MSRGFIAALVGVAVTIVSWYGPWEWPAWPALTILRVTFGGNDAWQEMSFGARAAVMTLLIAVNCGFWGAIAFAAMRLRSMRWRRS